MAFLDEAIIGENWTRHIHTNAVADARIKVLDVEKESIVPIGKLTEMRLNLISIATDGDDAYAVKNFMEVIYP